jgi:hypothetical protein
MLELDLNLTLERVWRFFNLPTPDEALAKEYFRLLGRMKQEDLDAAIDRVLRETKRIYKGDNVAKLILDAYEENLSEGRTVSEAAQTARTPRLDEVAGKASPEGKLWAQMVQYRLRDDYQGALGIAYRLHERGVSQDLLEPFIAGLEALKRGDGEGAVMALSMDRNLRPQAKAMLARVYRGIGSGSKA